MFGDISAGDWLVLIARWAHAAGAVAWIGGSIFFAAVLRPVSEANPELMRKAMGPIGSVYREVVDISIVAILVSGVILMFDRLNGNDATVAWIIVLAVKLSIALWMFYLVWRLRQSGYRPTKGGGVLMNISWLLGYNALMVLGVIVFFLATLLRELFEKSLAGG
jgi:uncharacterized membrane protein